MPSYSATFPRVNLGGFYDGLSLIALNATVSPGISQNATAFNNVAGGDVPPQICTFGSANAAHSAILVYLCLYSSAGVFLPDAFSITDTNGNTYNTVGTQQDGTGGTSHLSGVFCASDVAAGSNTISVSWTYLGAPVNCNVLVAALEVVGVATSSTVADFTQTKNPGGGTPTLTVTASATPFLVACDCELFANATANGYKSYLRVNNMVPGSIAAGIAVLVRPKPAPVLFVCT